MKTLRGRAWDETDVASRQDTGVLLAETASTIALTAASDAAASVAGSAAWPASPVTGMFAKSDGNVM